MDDAVRMGVFEGGAHLAGEVDDLLDAFRWLVVERRALDQFHYDEGGIPGFACIVDRSDVGMVEQGSSPGFAQEAGAALAIQYGLGKDLDRDVPLEQGVVSTVDDGHAALADLGVKAVPSAKEGADRFRHQITIATMGPNDRLEWIGHQTSASYHIGRLRSSILSYLTRIGNQTGRI